MLILFFLYVMSLGKIQILAVAAISEQLLYGDSFSFHIIEIGWLWRGLEEKRWMQNSRECWGSNDHFLLSLGNCISRGDLNSQDFFPGSFESKHEQLLDLGQPMHLLPVTLVLSKGQNLAYQILTCSVHFSNVTSAIQKN